MTAQDTIQQMITEAQAKVEALQSLQADVAREIDEAHTRGYQEGRLEQGTDLIYTEAEFKAKVLEATATLQAQVDNVPAQIEASKASFKADLLSQYETQQVAETDSETGFRNLLK